eukprot:2187146-Alexandrium_andersonii.AAC.1
MATRGPAHIPLRGLLPEHLGPPHVQGQPPRLQWWRALRGKSASRTSKLWFSRRPRIQTAEKTHLLFGLGSLAATPRCAARRAASPATQRACSTPSRRPRTLSIRATLLLPGENDSGSGRTSPVPSLPTWTPSS